MKVGDKVRVILTNKEVTVTSISEHTVVVKDAIGRVLYMRKGQVREVGEGDG